MGVRLFTTDPVPFTAVLADLSPVEPTPPAGGIVQPQAVPQEAAVAQLLWFVSNDDTFEPLSEAEIVLLPRVQPQSGRTPNIFSGREEARGAQEMPKRCPIASAMCP